MSNNSQDTVSTPIRMSFFSSLNPQHLTPHQSPYLQAQAVSNSPQPLINLNSPRQHHSNIEEPEPAH